MDREEILARLNAIEGTLVTNYGAFDSGIEFRVLTSVGCAFVSGPGEWPVEGPLAYSEEDKIIGELLSAVEYEGGSLDVDELKEMIEDYELEPLPVEVLKQIAAMDEDALYCIKQMTAAGCVPGREYTLFFGEDPSDATAFETEEDAMRAFLEAYVSEGTSWEDMEDDELEDTIDYLDDIAYELGFVVDMTTG